MGFTEKYNLDQTDWDELEEFAGEVDLDPEEYEDDEELQDALIFSCNELDEADWDNLSNELQEWVNEKLTAIVEAQEAEKKKAKKKKPAKKKAAKKKPKPKPEPEPEEDEFDEDEIEEDEPEEDEPEDEFDEDEIEEDEDEPEDEDEDEPEDEDEDITEYAVDDIKAAKLKDLLEICKAHRVPVPPPYRKDVKKLRAYTLKKLGFEEEAPKKKAGKKTSKKTTAADLKAAKARAKTKVAEKKKKKRRVSRVKDYKREFCIADTLKKMTSKGLTMEQIASQTNKRFIKRGGLDNLNQSMHVTKVFLPILIHLGLAHLSKSGKKVLPGKKKKK